VKKAIPILISLMLVIILGACSAQTDDGNSTSDQGESTQGETTQIESINSNPDENETTDELNIGGPTDLNTLLIGTVMLEGSDLAVSVEQAQELLPLWKAMRSLMDSDTTADTEIQALTEQIKETMTAEQIDYIESGEFTQGDMRGLFEELGIELPGGGFEMSPEMQATREAMQESGEGSPGGGFRGGGIPGGGLPGGGQGVGQFGGDLSPEQMETLQAQREAGGRAFGNRMITIFIEPMIELLEARAAE
jgi:hypothetical protein